MSWFKRKDQSIYTPTEEKRNTPEGLWYKMVNGKYIHIQDLQRNAYVDETGHHLPISSNQYFDILFDRSTYDYSFTNICSCDPLNFQDLKSYKTRVKTAQEKTNLKDAIQIAVGKTSNYDIIVGCMDFRFIGGSMGSVVGEKISRSIDYCIEKKYPLLLISKSGGARMQESGFSLMQLAKTASKLTLLNDNKIPFISLMTNPTTGGVTASFAMLGDFNIAEPKALIGFAGPRVIRETIGKDLPEGFQSSEFLLEHGFVDFIINRKLLKQSIGHLLSFIYE